MQQDKETGVDSTDPRLSVYLDPFEGDLDVETDIRVKASGW